MNKLLLSLSVLVLLSACASKPATKSADNARASATSKEEETKPTYTDKAGAMTVADVSNKTKCPPRDNAWNGMDWKRVIPMANACVKAKDWRKVDAIGAYLGIHAALTPWGAYYMSVAAGERKDYPRAIWMMELALKKSPNQGLFHYQLGRMHWEMENEDLALKELKLAADLSPDLTDAHWIMGQLALQKGEYAQAEKHLDRALNNEPRHWQALMAMASLKSKEKNWTAAESYLSRALRVNPKDQTARQALTQVLEMQAKNQAAKPAPKVSSGRAPTSDKKVTE